MSLTQEAAAQTGVEALLSVATDLRNREAADREQSKQQAWRSYATIIGRVDDPHPHDARDLAFAMSDLGFSADDVRADIAAIAEAKRLLALHAELPAARTVAQDELESYNAFTKTMHDEERARFMKKIVAQSHADTCRNAASLLDLLRRQRPHLFTADFPPSLNVAVTNDAPRSPSVQTTTASDDGMTTPGRSGSTPASGNEDVNIRMSADSTSVRKRANAKSAVMPLVDAS